MKAERRSGALSLERAGNDRAYVDWFVSASGVSALGSLADIFVSLRLTFQEHCFCRCAKHPISWRPNDLAE